MLSVFQKFGGIRPMATAIGAPASTIKSWHVKRQIPGWRHRDILQAAKALGLNVTPNELERVRPDASTAPAGRGVKSATVTA